MLFREKILRIHIKWEKGSQWSAYSCVLCALVRRTERKSVEYIQLHVVCSCTQDRYGEPYTFAPYQKALEGG